MTSFDPAAVRQAVAEFTPLRPQKFQDLIPATRKSAVTNARFASLHGLPVAPSPSRRRPLHFTNRALVTSWHSAGRRRGRLPSAARRRALRSGCDALGASRRPPLHFPRSPNADRSQCSISQWHMRIAHVGMVAIRLNVDNAMKPAFIVQRRWSRQGRAPPPPASTLTRPPPPGVLRLGFHRGELSLRDFRPLAM